MKPGAIKQQAAAGGSGATMGTLRLVLTYAAFAGIWILLSDKALALLFDDPGTIVAASTMKGWAFVAITSLLLYGLVRRLLNQILASAQREQTAQTESQRAQKLLAAIVDSSSDAIFAKDLEGRYIVFNRECARLIGIEKEPALGRTDLAMFPPAQAELIRANDLRVIAENRIVTYEELLSTADGERTYLATKGPLHDEDGRVVGMFGISRDITVRKRAELEVRTLSRALEQSPSSIVITDPAGNIEYVNPHFERVTGYAAAEVIGRNPRVLKSGLTAPETYVQLWATISTGREWRGELCNRRKDGELFWEFAAISGITGENGGIEHYVAVKEDITQRKLAEAKFRRLSNLYAALSECNQAVMRCATEQELFEQVCSAVVNLGNMKLAWVGRLDPASKRVLPVAFHGENTAYVEGIEVSADAGQPSGQGPAGVAIRENRAIWCQDFLNDAATVAWHERARGAGWQAAAALPLCRGGTPIGALSIYSPDINAFDGAMCALLEEMAANISFALDHFAQEDERRRAEASLRESESRLSAVFHASPMGIAVTTVAQGRVLDANDAALRLFGYRREEAIGRKVAELGVFSDPAQGVELAARLAEQRRVERYPIDVRHSSGTIGKMELTGQVIELYGELCLVAMLMDVTERERLQEVHLRAQKLESLGTLAGGIAHDFNNILAAIRGNADLAARDVGSGHAAAASLQEIRKASMRANELVRRILAFARPAEAQREAVDLSKVVSEVLGLLRATLPAGISLKTEFSENVPRVLADTGQVHEAVVNLTTNAAYAIGRRSGVIEYRVEAVQVGSKLAQSVPGIAEGRYVRLTVSDSGCGMDAATQARVFDAFFTTKPVGEGAGLGLSMVHGTMRSHGGAVAMTSAPGEGAIFALYFPEATAEAQQDAATDVAPDPAHAGQRVLYVDDEEALVFLASRALSDMGHKVTCFTDPEQALHAFRAGPREFDVVVTDLSMPHLSGFDLAREVLALRPNMPVLLTSGYLDAEDEAQARAAGVSEIVLKPATMDELGQVLDRLIRRVQHE